MGGLTKNVEKILSELPPDPKIIPGHDRLSTPADLKICHRMLSETTKFIRDRMAEGESLKEIRAAGIPEEWESWGTGFISAERWIETLHGTLKRQQRMGRRWGK